MGDGFLLLGYFSILSISDIISAESNQTACNPCYCDDRIIDCSDLNITSLSDFVDLLGRSAKDYHGFRKIVLSRNKITYISRHFINRAFKGDITDYDFSDNAIGEIEPHAFDTAVSMNRLDLARNNLINVEKRWFTGLDLTLEYLNLSSNEIKYLFTSSLSSLDNLIELDLSDNVNLAFDKLAFSSLQNLRRLYMRNCQITNIANETFSPISKLETLDLSFNKLISMPDMPQSMSSLILDGNNFKVLSLILFPTNLWSLETLSLNNMPFLTTIEQCAFCRLRKIRRIFISKCRSLSSVADLAFGKKKPQKLETIDFSENNLTKLPATLISWDKAKDVRLFGNYWTCDCSLSWIVNLKTKVDETASCSQPISLSGRPLESLNSSDFDSCLLKFSVYRTILDSTKVPKLLISLIGVSLLFVVLLLTWYLCTNRRDMRTVSERQKAKLTTKRQPFAYRNLAMQHEQQDRNNWTTDAENTEDLIMNPIFETLDKPTLI